MSEGELQAAGGVGWQLQGQPPVGASSSFRYVNAAGRGMGPPQASIAARSFSDIGPHSIAKLGNHWCSETISEEAVHGGSGVGGIKTEDLQNVVRDALFFQQYNKVYRTTEEDKEAPGHYACSYGGKELSRGGAGSWSMRLDPEVRRRGRLASYRAISFESKLKSSIKRSFKWLKHRCASLVRDTDPDTTKTNF
ncbi:hypothetical protein KP509_22G005300 [Ceratopteris richardii]|uniref:Uncharacterized protein n=1 Tax=Ceratopteris richardii TaxID=49495 RepID=A0A8T2S373_CERRI|nr:hypothetical protein KP509_22G005300 [Ceratopteris richardii]